MIATSNTSESMVSDSISDADCDDAYATAARRKPVRQDVLAIIDEEHLFRTILTSDGGETPADLVDFREGFERGI